LVLVEKLGPEPTGDAHDTARHRALSAASRVRMLDLVTRAAAGLTAAQVVEATGLHPSTVRAHLDKLTESGLLSRRRQGDGSPGRPAWRYQAVPRPDGDAGPAGAVAAADGPYRALAAALIAQLTREADDPHSAGIRAGRDWGRSLAAALGPGGKPRAVDGLVEVLAGLGFTPEVVERPGPGDAVMHLRTCPYLDLALADPDVVCGVHLGVIGGAMGALGASATDTDLEPFAVPGACVVRVRTGSGRAGP
jgi:predicted ArsR family transcriptional regulator